MGPWRWQRACDRDRNFDVKLNRCAELARSSAAGGEHHEVRFRDSNLFPAPRPAIPAL